MHYQPRKFRLFSITALAATLLLSLSSLLLAVPDTTKADSNCQYFQETQHSACGKFLEYWNSHGGLAQQGYPVSDEFTETNAPPPAGDGKSHTVQYFQRARFEYHPENQPPYDVLLGLLGSEQFTAKYNGVTPVDKEVQHPRGTCQHFDATGFDVCGVFLTYWQAHGGLAQQGYPVSDTFLETNAPPPAGDGQQHVVQYFQRARFELHGDDTSVNNVELGLLGSEQLGTKYPNGAPMATPNPPIGTTTVAITTPPSNTPTPTPTKTNTNSYVAIGCLPAVSTSGNDVEACVDNSTPTDNSTVTVYGRLVVNGQAVSGVTMGTSWHYKTTTSSCSATTDNNGVASCGRDISRATKGYTVEIDVSFAYGGQSYSASTNFTPQ